MGRDTPLHATCVTFEGAGVLITGASGSGKSALALQLMALGATLVADDRVVLTLGDSVMAQPADGLAGLIEARGVGILNAKATYPAPLAMVVDLDVLETDRIPPQRSVTLMEHTFPLFHKVDGIHLAAAIIQFLKSGRSER